MAKSPAARRPARGRASEISADHADRDVLLGARQRCAPGRPCARARRPCAERRPATHRLDQLAERPDRRHADGAGADEAHLVAPGRGLRERRRIGSRASRVQRREVRHAPAPGDQRADQHRDADPQADQVADAEQRERQAEVEAGDAAAVADAEIARHVAGEDARRARSGEHRRDDRAPQHAPSSPARLSSTPACRRARRRRTLSTSAQATPSGYGRSDCVTSARRSGIEYITPRMPPSAQIANDIQYGKPVHQPMITRPGSTKMMRGQRAGGRGDRLHDVVLLDGRAAQRAQHRHGDDRRRDRGGEGQAGLEAEVDVGRGEHHA